MKTYKPLYLIELIQLLNDLPADAQIRGFYGYVTSYSAYWDRNAIPYSDYPGDAHEIAKDLLGEIGKTSRTGNYSMSGDDTFTVNGTEFVYLVKDGDKSGKLIIGLEVSHQDDNSRPVYVPVVLADAHRI